MRKVLVTGAGGFVGNYLCNRLLNEGWYVRGTFRSDSSQINIPRGVEAVKLESIDSNTDWSGLLSGVDTVVHLAARVHVTKDSAGDSLSAYREVNVGGTENLALASATRGISRFIYLSSVKVNGESSDRPYSEKDVAHPVDSYAASKWEAEQSLWGIGGDKGLEVVILRPPLVYGPGVKANFLRLLHIVNRGIPLPLKNVSNRRSLIYLGNLIDAIVTCINHPDAPGKTYLVSDDDDISTPQLIQRIADALGKPARVFPFPVFLVHAVGKALGMPEQLDRLLGSLLVDIGKIRSELGWFPPYTMMQGLKDTCKWYT